MSERDHATRLANKILEDASRDPDSDLSVLARQFLRSLESTTPEITSLADVAERVWEAITFGNIHKVSNLAKPLRGALDAYIVTMPGKQTS